MAITPGPGGVSGLAGTSAAPVVADACFEASALQRVTLHHPRQSLPHTLRVLDQHSRPQTPMGVRSAAATDGLSEMDHVTQGDCGSERVSADTEDRLMQTDAPQASAQPRRHATAGLTLDQLGACGSLKIEGSDEQRVHAAFYGGRLLPAPSSAVLKGSQPGSDSNGDNTSVRTSNGGKTALEAAMQAQDQASQQLKRQQSADRSKDSGPAVAGAPSTTTPAQLGITWRENGTRAATAAAVGAPQMPLLPLPLPQQPLPQPLPPLERLSPRTEPRTLSGRSGGLGIGNRHSSGDTLWPSDDARDHRPDGQDEADALDALRGLTADANAARQALDEAGPGKVQVHCTVHISSAFVTSFPIAATWCKSSIAWAP